MDSTAISLCRDNKLPILVFNMTKPGNIRRVVLGEPLGTLVLDERREPRRGTPAPDHASQGERHGQRHRQEPAGRPRQGDRGVQARARPRSAPAAPTWRSSTACASTTTARRRRSTRWRRCNVADARLITIKPWERTLIPEIEKAIRAGAARAQPAVRRRARAPADAGAHPGAPPGAGQGGQEDGRGGARSPCAARAATPTRC